MSDFLSPGRLIGVSLGPGDPGLITRAAWAALQRRDAVWVYPARSAKTPSYALGIIERAQLAPPGEHATLLFPMTHDGEKLARAWLRAAQTVLPWLQAGRDVLFLVEGDASTYATFGHLARTVRGLDARIAVQTLPGVNAFTAACADAGVPLAEQDDTVAIVPAGNNPPGPGQGLAPHAAGSGACAEWGPGEARHEGGPSPAR